MRNRFEKCNSLVDLYYHFTLPSLDLSYGALTEEEKTTVLNVYCSAIPSGVKSYGKSLSEAGYQEIFNNTLTIIGQLYAAGNNTNKGDKKNMKNNKFMNTVNGFHAGVAGAVGSAKVKAGQDFNAFKTSCDGSITTIKDCLGVVLTELDYLTGTTALKNQLMGFVYRDTVGTTSKRGFFDCATECRRAVESYINTLLALDPDEEDLKTVVSLRYMLGQDEDGNQIVGRRSVFAAFANGIVWICKKVFRKLRGLYETLRVKLGSDAESNIFGSVGAGIASVFGVACGVIKAVVQIAVSFVVYVGSYILSAVINAIAWVLEKFDAWKQKAKDFFTHADELEDEELDEELEDEEDLNGAQ